MIYLDTSLLVSTLVQETSSDVAIAWFADRPDAQFAISDWVKTEIASALSMKVRRKAINAAQRVNARAEFDRQASQRFHILVFSPTMFTDAAQLVARTTTGLRASDALHLAIVRHHGVSLATRDHDLYAAAHESGVMAVLI